MAKFIEAYFKYLADRGGSDLHIASGVPPMIRLHGELRPIADQPLNAAQVITMMKEVLPNEDILKLKTLKNLDFGLQWTDPGPIEGKRYRANAFIQKNGPNMVFRAISSRVPTLKELSLPEDLERFAGFHQGLILVTGATGCGKSSTVAALINIINETRPSHVITVEDPIEFVHQNKKCLINQREVGKHVESFQMALKGALREDPDVILVGELRDIETMSLAVTAAETGHVVFGTLHTSSAAKTVDRLIDSFPVEQQAQIRTMLSESIKGVIAQQLVPRADGKGRIAAVEVLVGTPPVANMIREGKAFQLGTVMQVGRSQGMVLMDDYLRELYSKGLIKEADMTSRLVSKAKK